MQRRLNIEIDEIHIATSPQRQETLIALWMFRACHWNAYYDRL